jgi:phosphoglycerate dehydrogenase-like enzyme
MRIHIQNLPDDDPDFALTREQWDDAARRAGEQPANFSLTTGHDDATFAAGMADAEAYITSSSGLARHRPAFAPKLKLIFATSAGLERHAPFDWIPDGATLLNNSGAHGARLGEYIAMALLMLAGRMPELIANQHAEHWKKLHSSVIAGSHVTIVGLGGLGSAAARHASRLGLHVTGVRTRPEPHPDCAEVVATTELDKLLPSSRYIILATPLTAATQNILDRRRLSLLPRGAGVINVGRGKLIEQDALCDLLESGHIGGAVLDVFNPEPVPAGHRLWRTKNLVMTPHISADDPKTYNPESFDIFFRNLQAWRRGEALPNQFDTVRGY